MSAEIRRLLDIVTNLQAFIAQERTMHRLTGHQEDYLTVLAARLASVLPDAALLAAPAPHPEAALLRTLVIAWDSDRSSEFIPAIQQARAFLGFKLTDEKAASEQADFGDLQAVDNATLAAPAQEDDPT